MDSICINCMNGRDEHDTTWKCPECRREENELIDFFIWLNDLEELQYTEKGIHFYVNKYLESK